MPRPAPGLPGLEALRPDAAPCWVGPAKDTLGLQLWACPETGSSRAVVSSLEREPGRGRCVQGPPSVSTSVPEEEDPGPALPLQGMPVPGRGCRHRGHTPSRGLNQGFVPMGASVSDWWDVTVPFLRLLG